MQDTDIISSGIKELWLLKSHWSVSAVINYERQTGWCSQMKQNMFGCAAQPSNDAGKQKDNCPLRWLGKSLSRNRTAVWAVSSRGGHLKQEQQQMSAHACSLVSIRVHTLPYLWSHCWLGESDWGTGGNCFRGIGFPVLLDLVGQTKRHQPSPPKASTEK